MAWQSPLSWLHLRQPLPVSSKKEAEQQMGSNCVVHEASCRLFMTQQQQQQQQQGKGI